MQVRAIGRGDGNLYLNSEADYRSADNLSIAIPISSVDSVDNKFGGKAGDGLKGCYILVKGQTQQVKILKMDGVAHTYYYQPRVTVTSANQIKVIARPTVREGQKSLPAPSPPAKAGQM